MSDAGMIQLLRSYQENVSPPFFLTSFCQAPPENFHSKDKVEIDIVRGGRKVATPLPARSSGAKKESLDQYTNKGWTPPVYDLETTIESWAMYKRRPGRNPFEDREFLADARAEAFSHMRHLETMIRRAVELQVSQLFGTGTLSLVDENGNVMFSEDFNPKSDHFITAGTAWGEGSEDKLQDLSDLRTVIHRNGKVKTDTLLFGKRAAHRFLADDAVQKQLDNQRMEIGRIDPTERRGAADYGFVKIDGSIYRIWVYDDEYEHPQTGTSTLYVDQDDVIMLSSGETRLDLTYGTIPTLAPPDARAAQFLPTRFAYSTSKMDMSTYAWISPDGKHLNLSIGTRALVIPTSIDGFGRLRTA